jgi:hypothetical protein
MVARGLGVYACLDPGRSVGPGLWPLRASLASCGDGDNVYRPLSAVSCVLFNVCGLLSAVCCLLLCVVHAYPRDDFEVPLTSYLGRQRGALLGGGEHMADTTHRWQGRRPQHRHLCVGEYRS